jgi:large subunit ribosomal protein L10
MPSFINEALLKDVAGLVKANPSLILVDSSRLNAADTLKLRKNLHDAGAKMKVAKVNLLRRAVPQEAVKLLDGKTPVSLVSAKDMIAAAKILADLEKEEKVRLKGGLMDGQVIDPATVKKLASMPSKEVLRGMLVNLLAAPLVGLARVISEIAKKKQAAGG